MYLIEDDETNLPAHSSAPAAKEEIASEFKRAFRLVTLHYRCSAEEYEEAKALALQDLENAVPCYLAMEREILGPAKGINERIRADVQTKGDVQ